jgi:PKD repeat protein
MRFNSAKVILFILVMMLVLSGAASASEQSADGAAAVRAELSKLPLSFIPNQGQADPAVLFQVKAEGHTIFLTKDDVVLVTDNDGTPVSFSTTVAGANPAATVVGVDPLPGTASFFIGNDPAYWQSGLETYGGVEYKNILPGIDLTYRGNNGVLKREFVVAPGADASGIVIVYDGVDGLAYGPDGTLEVQTPAGVLTETAPVCYQVINGNTVDVPAQYNILGNGRVGFNFGVYDTAYPLVIDPALLYSSYLGGVYNDAAMGIAVKSTTGEAYVTGYTDSYNFPRYHAFNMTPQGCSDIFVTKFSANGGSLMYSTYLGGNNTDVGNGIAVDSTGRAFVTGYTKSQNFPVQNGTPKNINESFSSPCPFPGCIGDADAFLSEISPDGGSLLNSTCFGGNSTDGGTSVAVQPDGQWVYLTGYTNSDNFPVTGNALQPNLNSNLALFPCDAFIIIYAPGNVTPNYSSYLGGADNDQGLGITFNGTIPTSTYYVTGWTQSIDFPIFPIWSVNSGEKDVFVSKFTYPNTIAYSRYIGGEGDDEGRGIAVKDIAGSEYAHVTGVTYSMDFPITNNSAPFGAAKSTTPIVGDAFITKLGPVPGDDLNFSVYLGGTNSDGANGIALDVNNNIYITGYTSSSNFPCINAIPTFEVKRGFQDAFITMVNSDTTTLNFSTYLGGSLDDTGTGIAVSDPQNIFVSGVTSSYNFPVLNPFIRSPYNGNNNHGLTDGFVTRINNVQTPASLEANFTYTVNNLEVSFTDTSTGGPMPPWQWNFGDGSPNATVQNPIHTYTAPGPYWVTLTVSNTLPSSSTKSKLITVTTPPGPKFTDANSTTAIGEIHIAQNGTRKVSLYLNSTPTGLTGYNVTVSFRNTTPPTPYVPNTEIANITNVSKPGWIPHDVDIFWTSDWLLDGYNVTFTGIDLQDPPSIPPGKTDVRLANITIHGNQIGNSTLHINNTWGLTDAGGDPLSLLPPDYNLTVYVEKLQTIPYSVVTIYKPWIPQTPKDLNGDGLYEDVNGDTQPDFDDVRDFARNLYWISNPLNEYQPFFDFDQNGDVNFQDVRVLCFSLPPLIPE